MTQTRRERLREATQEEIKGIARQQMAEQGAASLSLRAIARQMGLTAPALYRYFENRDALVTALIADAYTSLAVALETARDALSPDDHHDRLLAVALAYREWAVTHSQDYALIFGTPIPGYHAPMEVTAPLARRNLSVLVELLAAAQRDGELSPPSEYADSPPELKAQLLAWRDHYGYSAPTPVLHLALAIWGHVHGLVTLEIFHHLGPNIGDAEALYRAEALAWFGRAGLSPIR